MAEKSATGLLLESSFTEHQPGEGHPESPARYTAIQHRLEAEGLVERCVPIPHRAATDEQIDRCHGSAYRELAEREIEAGRDTLSTGDTNVCPQSLKVALHAAGSAVAAVDLVIEGSLENAFCAVRPPGHHASPNKGMGFCVFNNVAVAARHAQVAHGLERVAIVDWDVHHGNGTQDIFYEDGSVYFASTHQSPWYPFTGAANERGEGKGAGCNLNIPIAAGRGMETIGLAFRDEILPALRDFRPQMLFISAGFDSRIDDPLGQLQLRDEDFAELTKMLMKVASETAENRVVSVLEGGYNVDGLASAVTAHLRALMGD